jgi:tetratricopeptide (TPR) repeat protein
MTRADSFMVLRRRPRAGLHLGRTRIALLLVGALLSVAGVKARGQAVPTISDSECQKLASVFERHVREGDTDQATQLIDWDAILKKATAGFGESADVEQARADFIRGVLETARESGGLASQVSAAVEQGGSYRLLRIHRVNGQPRALFRLLLPESGGVNYYDLTFSRDATGRLRINDIHLALSGEFLSDTLRRAWLPIVAKAAGVTLKDRDAAYIKHLNDLQKMVAEAGQERYAEALSIFRGLPPVLQADRNILLIRLQAAQRVGDEEYSLAVADLERLSPRDSCVDLLTIDGHLLRGHYAAALAAVERLEESIGGDPYLHVLRAGIHYQAGDLPAAESAARQAIAGEPTLEDAYWQVATFSLDTKKFDTTVEMLDLLQTRFGIELEDLTKVPEYADFVKSPQYRKWAQTRKP